MRERAREIMRHIEKSEREHPPSVSKYTIKDWGSCYITEQSECLSREMWQMREFTGGAAETVSSGTQEAIRGHSLALHASPGSDVHTNSTLFLLGSLEVNILQFELHSQSPSAETFYLPLCT